MMRRRSGRSGGWNQFKRCIKEITERSLIGTGADKVTKCNCLHALPYQLAFVCKHSVGVIDYLRIFHVGGQSQQIINLHFLNYSSLSIINRKLNCHVL